MGDVTELIERARAGERSALDRLFELLYPSLRRLAHARLAGHQRPGEMGTTSLVNECYLKFQRAGRLGALDRSHFFAYCARTMRSIIVDEVRSARAERRGGDAPMMVLDTEVGDGAADDRADDRVLELHEALEKLSQVEPRLVQVVEMRYFAGMSDDEIAQALDVAARTVRRDWHKARLLLAVALED